MKKLCVLFISIISLCSALGFAARPGTTGFNFLKIEAGAKALGSGGAFSAVSDDGSAAYWNPAGLSAMRYQQLSLMHLNYIEGINYQFVSYIQPTKNAGTFGASAYYLTAGGIPSYDSTGAALDADVKASGLAVALSYARNVSGVGLGITAKFMRETLAGEVSNAYAADLGALYRLKVLDSPSNLMGQHCRLAFVVQNIGTPSKFYKESYPLPLSYRAGLAQDFFNDTLTVSGDIVLPSDDELYAAAGFDYSLTEWVSLRTGYKYKTNRSRYDIQPGVTAGIGLENEHIGVDYAFVPYDTMGATHRFGLAYRFGRAYDKDLLETNVHKHFARAMKYYRAKDAVNAYREFNNVLSADPLHTQAKLHIAQIQSRISEIKLERYLVLVRQYIRNDFFIEAEELLNTLLELFPDQPDVKESLAKVAAAIEQQKALRAESMFKQGVDFYKHQQYADAISLWEKVLMVNPKHASVEEHMAKAREEMAKLAEKKQLEEIETRRKKAGELFVKGAEFYKGKRWNDAKEMFEESNKLLPEQKETEQYLAQANSRLGEEYDRKGQKAYAENKVNEAISYWQQALRLAPDTKETGERLEKARGELKAANQAQAEEYNRQGLKEYDGGDLKQAVVSWEKAAALDPENTKIQNNLNRAKEELKKRK